MGLYELIAKLVIASTEVYITYELYRVLFSDKGNTKKSKLISMIGIAAYLCSAIFSIIQNNALIGFFMCVSVSFLFQGRWSWRAIGMLILFIGLAASEMLSGLLLIGITKADLSQMQKGTAFYIWGSILSRMIALFLTKIFATIWEKKKNGGVGATSVTVLILPLTSCLMICIIAWLSRFYDDIRFIALGLVMITVILVANIYLVNLVQKIYLIQIEKDRWQQANSALQHEIGHYKDIIEKQISINRRMHDIKNQVTAAIGLIQSGQYKDSCEILNRIALISQRDIPEIKVGNPAIDAIISAKMYRIQTLKVNYKQDIILPEPCMISYEDLAVIIGNALDNALNASQKVQQEDHRLIKLTIHQIHDFLCIRVDNYINEDECEIEIHRDICNPDYFLLHGFGLQNIKMLTQKYEGDLQISKENHLFSLSILLLNRIEQS